MGVPPNMAQQKIRLLSRQNLDKSDVETVYGELVRVIGGTRYVGGVAVGPANGLLDYKNFSKDAGITNAFKANPYSLFALPLQILTYTSGTVNAFAGLPYDNIGVNPPFQGSVYALSIGVGTMASGTNAGTWKFFYNRQGTQTQIGISIVSSNVPATGGIVGNQGGPLSPLVPLQARDVLQFQCNTNNVAFTDAVGIVWIKSLHVKG